MSEVQIALLSQKVKELTKHLKSHKKDFHWSDNSLIYIQLLLIKLSTQ